LLAGSLAQADRNSVCFAFQRVIPRHGIPACQNPAPGMLAPAKRQSHRFSCSRAPPTIPSVLQAASGFRKPFAKRHARQTGLVTPSSGSRFLKTPNSGCLPLRKGKSVDSVAQDHDSDLLRAFFRMPPDFGSSPQNAADALSLPRRTSEQGG